MPAETAAERHAPTSALLDALLSEPVEPAVTIDWLMQRLGDRGFGIVLMVLGLLAVLPGLSAAAGLLLMFPAAQMMLAHPRPTFPSRVGARALPLERVGRLLRRVMPMLRWLERAIRPRWPTPFEATKRVVGAAVMLLAAALLTPLPLSNIPVAITVMAIAVAYLEEDGVLLAAALVLALVLVSAAGFLAWTAFHAAGGTVGLW